MLNVLIYFIHSLIAYLLFILQLSKNELKKNISKKTVGGKNCTTNFTMYWGEGLKVQSL